MSLFVPSLSVQPNDFTLAVQYATNATDTQVFFNPYVSLVVDQSNNVWIANTTQSNVEEINNQGVPYTYSPMTNSCTNCNSIRSPYALAIDSRGNAWVANGTTVFSLCAGTGAQCSNSYTDYTNSTYGDVNVNLDASVGLAFDGNGNLWITCQTLGTIPYYSLTELMDVGNSTVGTANFANYQVARKPQGVAVDVSGDPWLVDYFSGGYLDQISQQGAVLNSVVTPPIPTSLAFDQTGNVWVVSGMLNKYNSSGVSLSGSLGYEYGSLFGAQAVVVDGSNRIWVTSTNNGSSSSLGEFSNLGVYLGPSSNTGYESSGLLHPHALAIDESGNVWVGDENTTLIPGTAYYGAITKFVGLATPVLTPVYLGVQNGKIAAEP
jgi:hypothetical protein